MSMKRRKFFQTSLGAAGAALTSATVQARPNLEPAPQAVGMLYDSTLCVGCKACVSKCKEVNGMPPVPMGDQIHADFAFDLSPKTLNVIKLYTDGKAAVKDREKDGYAFEKRSCMHCVDPGCVSVCPVTSLTRDPLTGIVNYNPDVCIGCRTCMTGCPYNVPQYDYDNALGKIHKCEMCNQKGVERISKGGMTGCAEACPTGATLFGSRAALLEEAKRRLALKPGQIYNYPMGDVRKPASYHEKAVPNYQNHVWGEKEAGGTNVMHLSAVSYDKLGMPPLGERSAASISEGVQSTVYAYMALPAIALGGLSWIVRRNTEIANQGEEDIT
jgi:Fe-S-cluster-containing dehydrogenase component